VRGVYPFLTTDLPDYHRLCYSIALYISTSKPSKQAGKMSFGVLIDFRGFLDLRYTVLCIGTFFAILGLWIPSYYISTYERKHVDECFRSDQSRNLCQCRLRRERD
jgi:hypothetical protein